MKHRRYNGIAKRNILHRTIVVVFHADSVVTRLDEPPLHVAARLAIAPRNPFRISVIMD